MGRGSPVCGYPVLSAAGTVGEAPCDTEGRGGGGRGEELRGEPRAKRARGDGPDAAASLSPTARIITSTHRIARHWAPCPLPLVVCCGMAAPPTPHRWHTPLAAPIAALCARPPYGLSRRGDARGAPPPESSTYDGVEAPDIPLAEYIQHWAQHCHAEEVVHAVVLVDRAIAARQLRPTVASKWRRDAALRLSHYG
eukprot:gene20059-10435_t